MLAIEVRRGGSSGPVTVAISDTGCGLPEDVRQDLFRPRFTTKPTGNGLGLAVAREFVQQHGGLVALKGREGGGTRVTVELPAVVAAPALAPLPV